MNKPPAFQFYAQDFLTGVMYLTNEEIGIYIKMLAKQWTDEKIPKKRLGLFVGLEWGMFSDELKSKFEEKGDYIINIRLEIEREKKLSFLDKQSINGKKGGRPRLNKPKLNPLKSQKNPLEEEEEEEIENVIELEVYPTFQDFWDLYDKKMSKDKCERKWSKLNHDIKEQIINYIPSYRLSQPNKQYRKNPETFLNNESWNDEIIVDNKNQKDLMLTDKMKHEQ